jgi:GTP-binding protein Era
MRSGFVNIIGNPNVGKSTLLNALVGERLSIITAKAQTTRHRIQGIVSGAQGDDEYQIVYSDTPGILVPHYKMHRAMMAFVDTAIADADVILYVTDTVERYDKNIEYVERLQRLALPIIVIINKIDLSTPEDLERLVATWHAALPAARIFPTSATHKLNLDVLHKQMVALMPEGHAYYDADQLTDKNLRFFATEIIREKILLHYDKEVPYSVEVDIDKFEESEAINRIAATIYVARESQKPIIIGHGGSKLTRVGSEARRDMEKFFEKKVFLHLFVKVNPDWRDSERQLKRFGYMG